jgi:RNA polymerase sigma-70 factor (ECF subfamily)
MQPAQSSEARASTSTSRSLLARVHAHDPASWDRLVSLYSPLVWHWCRKMNLPQQDAADVFQEVFQAVAANIGGFRKEKRGDTFRGWLRTITKNKVLDHFRAEARRPRAAGGTAARIWLAQVPEADLPEADLPEEGVEETELNHQLFHRALAIIQSDFEERTWRAFWRVVVDGQSPHDVAQELAMTPGAVRVAKCRVLHCLRQELGDLTP